MVGKSNRVVYMCVFVFHSFFFFFWLVPCPNQGPPGNPQGNRVLIWIHFGYKLFLLRNLTGNWLCSKVILFLPHENLPLINLIFFLKKKRLPVKCSLKDVGSHFFNYVVFSRERLSAPPSLEFLAINAGFQGFGILFI